MARRDETAGGRREVAQLLRRQFRLAENARFLHRLPAFAADDDMPAQLDDLVRRLDQAERRAER